MNSIFRYILAREVYRKYSENRDDILGLLTFQNLGKLAWLIIFLFFLLAFTWAFAKKNDVKPEEISEGQELKANKWEHYFQDEIPIYQWTIEEDEYRAKDDPKRIDTAFYYLSSIKVDSTIRGQLIGVAGNTVIKNDDGTFVEFIKDRNTKTSKPNWEDILASSKKGKLSKEKYISIDHVMLDTTKEPEGRWFWHFIAGILGFYFLDKLIKSMFRFFKTSIPVYEKKPIYKRDRRFKTGQRVDSYKWVIAKYEKMTEEELSLNKKQHGSRFIFYLLLFGGIVMYFNHLWNS